MKESYRGMSLEMIAAHNISHIDGKPIPMSVRRRAAKYVEPKQTKPMELVRYPKGKNYKLVWHEKLRRWVAVYY